MNTQSENINTRKANLESVISKVAGMNIGLTIRGDQDFTFFTPLGIVSKRAANRIEKYFKNEAKSFKVEHDKKCGTFIYITF